VDPFVQETVAWDDLQVADRLFGLHPPVGLDETDHDVGAHLTTSMALRAEGHRFPHTGGHAQIDPQAPARPSPGFEAHLFEHRLGGRAVIIEMSSLLGHRLPSALSPCAVYGCRWLR